MVRLEPLFTGGRAGSSTRIFALQPLHAHTLSLTRCTHKTGTSSVRRPQKNTCVRDIKRVTRSEKITFHRIDRSFSWAQVRQIKGLLQCVAVCCSVLQCVAVCCSLFVVPAPRILESTCVTAETAVEGVCACLYV